MKKVAILILLVTVNLQLYSAGIATDPRWLQRKITNNTNQDIEVKVKHTLNCDKVTPQSEKDKCLKDPGFVLIFKLSPKQTTAFSDSNLLVSKTHRLYGQVKNSVRVTFPADPVTKTYASITYDIPDSDLEKMTLKNFYISMVNGKMQLQAR